MEFKYKIIDTVECFIKDSTLTEINIGCSNSQVVRVEKSNKIYFLKIAEGDILTSEYEKLKWLEGKIRVPKVVLYEKNDGVEYLITEAITGEMVCSDYYLEHPTEGVPIIVEAFKEIYKVETKNCPFKVDLDYKLNLVKNNIDNNLIDIKNISNATLERFESLEGIYQYLLDNRSLAEEELCFSHGDTSLPNIFALDNKFSGFIDVGECGIAEKWFDIAIVVKSIIRNYGKEAVQDFYKQLGVEENKDRIDYYLLMMELYL